MRREYSKVMHNVFDEFTNRAIFKLISQGHFDGLQSPISIGKEANIFSAKKGQETVVVKIYRLESCDFNRMYDYIKLDPRYSTVHPSKRKIVFAWAQREYRNLLKAREAGVRVPKPITFLHHVLVMEHIGKRQPAPKLKDAWPRHTKEFFQEVVEQMRKLHQAELVHADLSAFNILNDQERPVIIDMSQCTTLEDSRAAEYLQRDIKNVAVFFRKIGLDAREDGIRQRIIT
ncbi:serine protein kinase RIO [Candidatus Woesearchaeota archaeon]|nr:serine protein kinase RIO [Candidatus Woesearchaeota archaeon]